MFNPVKAVATSIKSTRNNVVAFREAYRYERMIAASQAHLDSIPVAHGYVHVYA